jgi:uncharacterized protein (TIGR02646 family)
MIPIARAQLDSHLAERLKRRSAVISSSTCDDARRVWRSADVERAGIRGALRGMAAGIERCMYCCDSRGTDIDHFEPIAQNPQRTFDWYNHMLACSSCNSNAKRDQFPRDEHGTSLLIDPSAEDPFDHLSLTFATGRYKPESNRGRVTIEVFDLNRPDLRYGRELAFQECRIILKHYLEIITSGDAGQATDIRALLKKRPFADVTYAMQRIADRPRAPEVLGGGEVVEALKHL